MIRFGILLLSTCLIFAGLGAAFEKAGIDYKELKEEMGSKYGKLVELIEPLIIIGMQNPQIPFLEISIGIIVWDMIIALASQAKAFIYLTAMIYGLYLQARGRLNV